MWVEFKTTDGAVVSVRVGKIVAVQERRLGGRGAAERVGSQVFTEDRTFTTSLSRRQVLAEIAESERGGD